MQLIRFIDAEHYVQIQEDLENLIPLWVQIESVTTDGHKSILKAIKKSLPDAVVQCCLVHIQRMCMAMADKFSKAYSGRKIA